jgi:hypothetical protein
MSEPENLPLAQIIEREPKPLLAVLHSTTPLTPEAVANIRRSWHEIFADDEPPCPLIILTPELTLSFHSRESILAQLELPTE